MRVEVTEQTAAMASKIGRPRGSARWARGRRRGSASQVRVPGTQTTVGAVRFDIFIDGRALGEQAEEGLRAES